MLLQEYWDLELKVSNKSCEFFNIHIWLTPLKENLVSWYLWRPVLTTVRMKVFLNLSTCISATKISENWTAIPKHRSLNFLHWLNLTEQLNDVLTIGAVLLSLIFTHVSDEFSLLLTSFHVFFDFINIIVTLTYIYIFGYGTLNMFNSLIQDCITNFNLYKIKWIISFTLLIESRSSWELERIKSKNLYAVIRDNLSYWIQMFTCFDDITLWKSCSMWLSCKNSRIVIAISPNN